MKQSRLGWTNSVPTRVALVHLFTLATLCLGIGTTTANEPPPRCYGYGNLQNISLTDWESGLGSWSASRNKVANPETFDTDDWAVVTNLPDGRTGQAAFVANLNIGDCALDDESGTLRLLSPEITIPAGVQVPRISLDHWFQTEFEYDGGNLKIDVNGSGFELIPPAAIEFRPYNGTLLPPRDDQGVILNTNPLASQLAFTGTDSGQLAGIWGQTRVNLLGVAEAGDTIRLRFDFGIDGCGGQVGWYVDEVQVYNCEAELPPSDCGNGVIDQGEQCDDGNDFINDGCSNTCQVESGWQCSNPTPPGTIGDPSFESGSPNPSWTELSTNFGTPICELGPCPTGNGTGPSDGSFWAWFGGVEGAYEESSVAQTIQIPSTADELEFDLEVPACDSASDYLEVLLNDNQIFRIDGSSPRCGIVGYKTAWLDISAFANGGSYELEFHAETFSDNDGATNFFVDRVALPGKPSACTPNAPSLTLVKKVNNNKGGSAIASQWILEAAGPTDFSGAGPRVASPPGFETGTYDLSESSSVGGYAAGDWLCDYGVQVDENTVTIGPDDAVTCTVTNEFSGKPTLTVIKQVENTHGGTAVPADFTIIVTASNPSQTSFPGEDSPGTTITLDAGVYSVSESGLPPGYELKNASADCSGTIAPGESKTCTITNRDLAPSLTIVKKVVNDHGGKATVEDFYVTTNAGILEFDAGSIVGDTTIYTAATLTNLTAEMPYNLIEANIPGYDEGSWSCSPNAGGGAFNAGTVTLRPGESAICEIINDDIAPSLTVIKQVQNNAGGTAVPSDFTIDVTATDPSQASFPGADGVGTTITLDAGSYSVSESDLPPGYALQSASPNCSGSIALGQSKTCTIVNSDIPASLTIIKQVENTHGGSAVPGDFTMSVTANNPSQTTFPGAGIPGTPITLGAGDYSVGETDLPEGYELKSASADCSGTIALGETRTCIVTNADKAGVTSLTLNKVLINDNGGTAVESDWLLRADGPTTIEGFGAPGSDDVQSGSSFSAGTYTLSEIGPPGYSASAWSCEGGSQTGASITLALGESVRCTITNDDAPPVLTLHKEVINNNGGDRLESDWTLSAADGPTPFSGPGPVVHSGPDFRPGTYSLSESGPAGYRASDWNCVGDGLQSGAFITLTLGQSATCTIINNDIAPRLTVVKKVINDHGGTATVEDFNVVISEGNLVFDSGSTVGDTTTYTSATLTILQAGQSYALSEDDVPGYAEGTWSCSPNEGGGPYDAGSVTLAPGEYATCTITNDDLPPSLTVIKEVENTFGGNAVPSDFTMNVTASDPSQESFPGAGAPGTTITLDAGFYSVSESNLPPGYQLKSASTGCSGSIDLGESKTCTITNRDTDGGTSLILDKILITNSGGTASESDWTLYADGPTPIQGPGQPGSIDVQSGPGFQPGDYVLSESSGPAGYAAGIWICTGGAFDSASNTLTLSMGEAAICTITNNDIAPTLTVIKEVENLYGGTAVAGDFTMDVTAIDPSQASFPGNSAVDGGTTITLDAGAYIVGERDLPPGYMLKSASADCSGSIALAESKTCVITNSDIAPTLTVNKVCEPDTDEGLFNLLIDGTGSTDTACGGSYGPIELAAGAHTVSESIGTGTELSSYESVIGGNCAADGSVNLASGQNKVCTITNRRKPTLTVNKVCEPDTDEGLFNLLIDGTGSTDTACGGSYGPIELAVGAHSVSETAGTGTELSSYERIIGGDCAADGGVSLASGENRVCTITNRRKPTLTVNKVCEPDTDEGLFNLLIDDTGSTDTACGGSHGPVELAVGAHTVSETAGTDTELSSYESVIGGDCAADGSLSLASGENRACTIRNTRRPTLSLVKEVINNNGGQAGAADWTLTAAGYDPDNPQPGTYVLSESGPGGYEQTSLTCGDQPGVEVTEVTLSPGANVTCTFVNNDLPPRLTLDKVIVNDHGGTAIESDWILRAEGPTTLEGPGAPGAEDVQSSDNFSAGTYTLSEAGPGGYTASEWTCVGGEQVGNQITLDLDQSAVCTIINDDLNFDPLIFSDGFESD